MKKKLKSRFIFTLLMLMFTGWRLIENMAQHKCVSLIVRNFKNSAGQLM